MSNSTKRETERDTTAAQLRKDLVCIATTVAKYRSTTVADLLDEIVRGPLEALEQQMADEIRNKRTKQAKKG